MGKAKQGIGMKVWSRVKKCKEIKRGVGGREAKRVGKAREGNQGKQKVVEEIMGEVRGEKDSWEKRKKETWDRVKDKSKQQR